MNINWIDVIKEEYENLKLQREQQISEIWSKNKATVSKQNNERKSPCGVWKVDGGQHLSLGQTVSIKFHGKDMKRKTEIQSLILPYMYPPPSMSMWIPVPRNFVSKDSKELQSVPYLGDDVIDDCFITELVDSYAGNWPGAKKEFIDDDIFVNLVKSLIPYQNNINVMQKTSPQITSRCDNINKIASGQEPLPDEVIFQSIDSYFNTNNSYNKYVTLTKHEKCIPHTPNLEVPSLRNPLQPEDRSLQSFRKLFCRRCYIYNCQLHPGTANSNVKKRCFKELERTSVPCSKMCYLWGANDINKQDKENVTSGADIFFKGLEEIPASHIQEICKNNTTEILENPLQEINGNNMKEIHGNSADCIEHEAKRDVINSENDWTFSDQSLLLALMKVFPNNSCAIAEAMINKSCQQVCVRMQSIETKSSIVQPDMKKKNSKNERQSKYDNTKSTMHLGKNYMPCDHTEPCNKTTECLCLNCEKFCSCDVGCKKRIPKCSCKGSCMTAKCVCYDGQRECDPDLCNCISCKNVGIQLGLEKKLQIIVSKIHGWGVATKESCKKSEFITEYKGELISKDEAQRRGKVYDKSNCTYMFTLNGETVIDSMRFGSKVRFANFSKTPNCNTKVMLVNGDHRIGIYAARFIEANEELTIDYNTYDPTLSNHK